jgi:hypothetical protein
VIPADETVNLLQSSLAIALEPLQYATAFTTLGSLIGYLDGSAIKRLSPTGVGIGDARFGDGQTNSIEGRGDDGAGKK